MAISVQTTAFLPGAQSLGSTCTVALGQVHMQKSALMTVCRNKPCVKQASVPSYYKHQISMQCKKPLSVVTVTARVIDS